MANLRTNNLSGEQGQNAIRGSVFFDGSSFLSFNAAIWNSQASDSCTFECWLWVADLNSARNIFDLGNEGDFSIQTDGQIRVHPVASNWKDTNNSVSTQSWHHIALVQESGRKDVYINGVKSSMTVGSGDPVASNWSNTNANTFNLGDDGTYRDFFRGYMSNVRVIKGVALYDDDFTPPFTELKATDSNTSLLCCQNSDDVTQEETGKTITGNGSLATAGYNKTQPKVIPPYGVDAGNTFGGPIQQSSQGYMYFPTGRTEERSRGFVVFGGGLPNTGNKYMDIVHIPTGGNTVNYGDLLNTKYAGVAVSSSTRGIWAGGFVPGYGGSASNVIESTELSSHSNTTDFGDLTVARAHSGGVQNSTRGVFMTGYTPSDVNTIDFITMATKGDATDFGDVIDAGWPAGGGRSSSTRGVLMGHGDGTNRIQFITIMTTGNSQDFGDLNTSSYGVGAGELSDGLRGIAMGGSNNPGSVTNVIDFITIATTGNATEFGDLTTARRGGGVGCTLTKGILAGGRTPTDCNIIDSIVIQSTGNAVDFGDTTAAVSFNFAGCSDSHGGLT